MRNQLTVLAACLCLFLAHKLSADAPATSHQPTQLYNQTIPENLPFQLKAIAFPNTQDTHLLLAASPLNQVIPKNDNLAILKCDEDKILSVPGYRRDQKLRSRHLWKRFPDYPLPQHYRPAVDGALSWFLSEDHKILIRVDNPQTLADLNPHNDILVKDIFTAPEEEGLGPRTYIFSIYDAQDLFKPTLLRRLTLETELRDPQISFTQNELIVLSFPNSIYYALIDRPRNTSNQDMAAEPPMSIVTIKNLFPQVVYQTPPTQTNTSAPTQPTPPSIPTATNSPTIITNSHTTTNSHAINATITTSTATNTATKSTPPQNQNQNRQNPIPHSPSRHKTNATNQPSNQELDLSHIFDNTTSNAGNQNEDDSILARYFTKPSTNPKNSLHDIKQEVFCIASQSGTIAVYNPRTTLISLYSLFPPNRFLAEVDPEILSPRISTGNIRSVALQTLSNRYILAHYNYMTSMHELESNLYMVLNSPNLKQTSQTQLKPKEKKKDKKDDELADEARKLKEAKELAARQKLMHERMIDMRLSGGLGRMPRQDDVFIVGENEPEVVGRKPVVGDPSKTANGSEQPTDQVSIVSEAQIRASKSNVMWAYVSQDINPSLITVNRNGDRIAFVLAGRIHVDMLKVVDGFMLE